MKNRCSNCLLPRAVPDSDIDDSGLCRLCRAHTPNAETIDGEAANARVEDLERALAECRGQAEYDCLVPLSGGKDSLLLLHKLKHEYQLNVLAFTVDVNIPKLATDNIDRALKRLDIDQIRYRPSQAFYRKLFRYLLCHQEARGAVYTVSYVYAPLFEGDAIKEAMNRGIPLVLAGYSPGQPEPERMFYEFSRKLISNTSWTPPALAASGEFSPGELSRFFAPDQFPEGTTFPRYLAPFHAWHYDQEQAMKTVVEAGLVASRKHASPVHSNYPINWLLMYSDLKAFGYNPYAPEFSALIREKKASKRYWQMMGPMVDFMIRSRTLLGKHVTEHMRWLELTDDDLQITEPYGAYDPVIAGQ